MVSTEFLGFEIIFDLVGCILISSDLLVIYWWLTFASVLDLYRSGFSSKETAAVLEHTCMSGRREIEQRPNWMLKKTAL